MTIKYVCLIVAGAFLAGCSGGGGVGQVPANQAPTISSIADQVVVANAVSDPIPFNVSDDQLSALSLSITSDRQDVVPNANLSVVGSGAARSIVVTPVSDTVGDALITIIASDPSGLSASSAFFVTVDAEQRSMQQFAREEFATEADDEPSLINAVDFLQDAEEDDFADLLAE